MFFFLRKTSLKDYLYTQIKMFKSTFKKETNSKIAPNL